jgi:hypothetical protein
VSPHRAVAACFILIGLIPAVAQPPSPPAKSEEIKLPSDAILVISDKAADVLRAVPKYYVLLPDRYNALMAEIDRLNKQLQARQPAPITAWKVTGKVKGNVVELKIVFSFVTDRDRATVALGCSRGNPENITLDGKIPPLWRTEQGLFLEVDKKGEHEAIILDHRMQLLDLQRAAPATGPRPEPLQGFDLDLPMTPITSVDIELPAGVKTVEVNDQAVSEPVMLTGNRLSGPLGSVKKLKVGWKAPRPATGPVALLTSRGRIEVKVLNGEVYTLATLTLQDLGRAARDWQLEVPERAQVRLANPDDRQRLRDDIQGSDTPRGKVTIPLAAPSSEPLTIIVTHSRPRGTASILVGPYAVLGASEQTGILWVVGEQDQRASCSPYHETRPNFRIRRRPQEEREDPLHPESRDSSPPGAIAAFQYASGTERPAPRDPWFKLDLDSIRGILDTTVEHTLELADKGPADWHLKTLLKLVPLRNEVDLLELDWPSPWKIHPERDPRSIYVKKYKEDLVRHLLRLDLDSDALQDFTVSLDSMPGEGEARTAFASVADWPTSSAVIPLPRPTGARNRRGHKVTIKVPKTLDLRVPQPPNKGMTLAVQERHRLEWQSDEFVGQASVAWKPYRPEVRAASVVDVVLRGTRIEIRQELELQFEEKDRPAPAEIQLRVPDEVRWLRRVLDGSKREVVLAISDTPGRWQSRSERLVRCPLDNTQKGIAKVVLKYEATAPQRRKQGGDEPRQRLVPVPLVSAVDATHGQMRARIWTDPLTQVRVEAPWEATRASEVVADHRSLPTLVVWALRPSLPLLLHIEPKNDEVERPPLVLGAVLIHVRVNESGFQQHRVRFLVRELSASRLELAFPAPVTSLNPLILLGDHKVTMESLDSAASDSEEGRRSRTYLGRLQLPESLPRLPVVLEVAYQLPPSRSGFASSLQTVFQPVMIPGLLAGVPIRWQLDLPPSWVPLPLDADASWSWGRRGWLLAPLPATTCGDLERWLWGEDDLPASTLSEEEAAQVPSYLCWGSGMTPLTLYHVPQTAWLLVCSLVVLLLGLTLGYAGIRRGLNSAEPGRGRLFYLSLTVIGLTAATVGLIWPNLFTTIVYGAEPGLAVLLVVLLVQWLLHESYRRRVVFLPGFRRVKTGSSLTRAARTEAAALPGTPRPAEEGRPPASVGSGRSHSSSGPRPTKEPSTVDAPADESPQL